MSPALTGTLFGVFVAAIFLAARLAGGFGAAGKTLLSALLTGAAAGLMLGLYIRGFAKRQAEAFVPVRERLMSEGTVVLDDAANHLYSGEYVGGRLFLTDDRLYFMADPMNVMSHRCGIRLEDIDSIAPLRTLGFTNGFTVNASGSSESFSVSKVKIWIAAIEKATVNNKTES